jgi:hypothetical protein
MCEVVFISGQVHSPTVQNVTTTTGDRKGKGKAANNGKEDASKVSRVLQFNSSWSVDFVYCHECCQ